MHFVGCVGGNINAGGKALPCSAQNDDRDARLGLDIRKCCRQLFHHRNVDYVQRRIRKSDVCNWALSIQCDPLGFSCRLRCHVSSWARPCPNSSKILLCRTRESPATLRTTAPLSFPQRRPLSSASPCSPARRSVQLPDGRHRRKPRRLLRNAKPPW